MANHNIKKDGELKASYTSKKGNTWKLFVHSPKLAIAVVLILCWSIPYIFFVKDFPPLRGIIGTIAGVSFMAYFIMVQKKKDQRYLFNYP